MKHTGLTGLTKIYLEISRTCSVNQRKLEKNGIAIEEMHAIYHDKGSKTHWNDYLRRKELFIKISISMY